MEVECIGNTQIIHMEETGMTQRTIGLLFTLIADFSTIGKEKKILSNCVIVNYAILRSSAKVNKFGQQMIC